MKFSYDKDVDILDIRLNKEPYGVSKELSDGVIVDYSKSGKIISIEILDASKRIPIEKML